MKLLKTRHEEIDIGDNNRKITETYADIIIEIGDDVYEKKSIFKKPSGNPGKFYVRNEIAIYEVGVPLSAVKPSEILSDVKMVGKYHDKGYKWRRFRP